MVKIERTLNFYSGREFELGLKRYEPEILGADLRLEILPLQKNAQYISSLKTAQFSAPIKQS
jgi:hypothetical protein